MTLELLPSDFSAILSCDFVSLNILDLSILYVFEENNTASKYTEYRIIVLV